VLGGGGAYPTPERGCSGYLVEQCGFRLLVDPGYATLPRLLECIGGAGVDAVFVSHAHGDHCADLNPLLRVRHLDPDGPPPLPLFVLRGSAEAVLALDADMRLDRDAVLHEVDPGDELSVGPFTLQTAGLAHFVDNVGVRVEGGAGSLVYSGDGGADPALADLAANATVLLTEATFVDELPESFDGLLANAELAGNQAHRAGVDRLVLTHLWPGADPGAASARAGDQYGGPIHVATPGLSLEVP
jgi:ribonuclease BN (tRNA processing enzyme)